MNMINIVIIFLLYVLLFKYVECFDIDSVLQTCQENWSKNKGCCTPTLHEDFKNCVTQKRRSLPGSSLGFKSISCQCHATPVTTEVRARTRWVQTFRQCLLTDDESKEHAPVHSGKELFQACEDGDLPAVISIMSSHPDKIDARGQHNQTALMVAAKFGKTDIFNFLACFNCDWCTLNNFNNNLLHFACIGGSVEIVKRLTSLGLYDMNTKGALGRTACHLAIRNGHKHIAELLFKSGCNIMVIDSMKNNMLHLACKSMNIEVVKFVIVKVLFSLESRKLDGKTPLLVASSRGFLEGCKYLIRQGSQVTAVDKNNNSLLHLVLEDCKHDKVVRLMMMSYFLSIPHVDRENRGPNGQTPLLMAAQKGCFSMFKLLLKERCNATAVDNHGNTILDLASARHKHGLVKHILRKGYIHRGANGKTALMVAALYGYIGMFQRLIVKGSDIEALDDLRRNVLHWACIGGNTEIIGQILFEKKLDIDFRDCYGYSPLMLAIKNDLIPAFMLLQRRGASTSLRDNDGNTILHLACIKGSKEMVKLFVKLELAKPFIQEKNANWQTPKQVATAYGFTEIRDILNEV